VADQDDTVRLAIPAGVALHDSVRHASEEISPSARPSVASGALGRLCTYLTKVRFKPPRHRNMTIASHQAAL
jgi:hypothetical protein